MDSCCSPKQTEPVTYRLKVWQLMQGQNATQAMRTNKPIVTKDVADITEATVGNIYTGPCKPPYLCDYIWNVQALNREGKPLGSNNGSSEPTMFMVSQYIIQLDSIKVLCTSTPGVYSFSYSLSNVNPGTAESDQLRYHFKCAGRSNNGNFLATYWYQHCQRQSTDHYWND